MSYITLCYYTKGVATNLFRMLPRTRHSSLIALQRKPKYELTSFVCFKSRLLDPDIREVY